MEYGDVKELSLFHVEKEEAKNTKIVIKGLIIGIMLGSALACIIILLLLLCGAKSEEGVMYNKQKEILDAIEQYYLHESDMNVMSDSICNAMIESLGDDYSKYYSKEQYQNIIRHFNESKTLEYYVIEGTYYGYVKIHTFSETTGKDFADVIKCLQEMELKAYIIDLRGNSGGVVDVAIECLDWLLPQGEIVTIRYANGKEKTIESDNNCFILPCAVLVDKNTISAAELFAGVLNNEGYAYLIGQRTYGKGVMQSYVKLQDGSAISLTCAEYIFMDGTGNRGGIVPDHVVNGDAMVIEEAIDYFDNCVFFPVE